jgi:hypothetical protein
MDTSKDVPTEVAKTGKNEKKMIAPRGGYVILLLRLG